MTLRAGEVMVLDGLLGPTDCAELLDNLRYVWWWDSSLVGLGHDGSLMSRSSYRRTSRTTSEAWLGSESLAILRRLERRLTKAAGVRPDHLEMWQATRYRRGDWFAEHHDAGFFQNDPWGDRTTTVLVYLDGHGNGNGGGGTVFPRLGVRFRPITGRVLMWRNLLADGTVDHRMLHEARPARSVKTTLTTWARQRPIRNARR